LLDFGIIPRRGKKELPVTVTNQGASLVKIESVETSCECLTLDLPRHEVKSGEHLKCNVRMDLAEEPDFVGTLQAGVTLYGTRKAKILSFEAMATVPRATK
jgi:hypothetical protein